MLSEQRNIKLSRCFREYTYIPLGGNRCDAACTVVNLFVIRMLTGLWNGAAWNYVLWGCITSRCCWQSSKR